MKLAVPRDSTNSQVYDVIYLLWTEKILFRKFGQKKFNPKEPNNDNPFLRRSKSNSVRIRMQRPF